MTTDVSTRLFQPQWWFESRAEKRDLEREVHSGNYSSWSWVKTQERCPKQVQCFLRPEWSLYFHNSSSSFSSVINTEIKIDFNRNSTLKAYLKIPLTETIFPLGCLLYLQSNLKAVKIATKCTKKTSVKVVTQPKNKKKK